jgi:hypothetical protein
VVTGPLDASKCTIAEILVELVKCGIEGPPERRILVNATVVHPWGGRSGGYLRSKAVALEGAAILHAY